MKHETHTFPRRFSWGNAAPLMLLSLVYSRLVSKHWEEYTAWEGGIGLAVCLLTTAAAVYCVVRRKVWEVSWSDERLQIKQGRRTLLDQPWSAGLLIAEDQTTFALTPRGRWRALYLEKDLCSPELATRLASHLPPA